METETERIKSNDKILEAVPAAFVVYLVEKLGKEGTDKGAVIACPRFDLDREGLYIDGFAVLTHNAFFVAHGELRDDTWVEKSFVKYSPNEFEEFKAENFVTTGALTAKLEDGTYFPLCFYTNTYTRKFGSLANLLEKIRKDEQLNDSDINEQEREEFCPDCGKRYTNPERKTCERCMKKGQLFIRVLSYAPKYKALLSLIIVFMLLGAGLAFLRPVISSLWLYDEVLNPESDFYGWIFQLVALIIVFEVVLMCISIFWTRQVAKAAAGIVYDIKTQLFNTMQNLSLSFYNNKQTGVLMNRVNSDAIHIQYFLVDGMPFFIQNFIMLIVIAVIIFSMNPLLGVFVFLPTPIIVFIIKKIRPKFRRLRWHRWVKSSKINAMLSDSLAGIRVVKAFGRERNEEGRFANANEELFVAQINERKMSIATFPPLHWVVSLGGLFVWAIGGYNVAWGNMSYGTLIFFTLLVGMIYGPFQFMVNILEWWADCMTSAHRIFEIMDTKPDVVESPDAVSVPRIRGRIELKGIKFEYVPNKPVLHGVSLDIAEGEMIGLVGRSGAGKSTITNLITRLYDVTEGAILIDGIDVRDIKIDDLRSQIGMVLQSTVLFNGTIAENIAYARPNASKDEIIAASRLANCHDFIMKMRDGYETQVGTGFSRLSGGELQRVSIARAILINPRLLILDEATASVDTETEAQIQEALERLVKGRTTIAIAHRLSTLRNADRLVVVDKGEIAEVGTHEELELKQGKYYDMLNIQKEALKIGGIVEDE